MVVIESPSDYFLQINKYSKIHHRVIIANLNARFDNQTSVWHLKSLIIIKPVFDHAICQEARRFESTTDDLAEILFIDWWFIFINHQELLMPENFQAVTPIIIHRSGTFPGNLQIRVIRKPEKRDTNWNEAIQYFQFSRNFPRNLIRLFWGFHLTR